MESATSSTGPYQRVAWSVANTNKDVEVYSRGVCNCYLCSCVVCVCVCVYTRQQLMWVAKTTMNLPLMDVIPMLMKRW